MKNKISRLPDSELDIMLVLWHHTPPMSRLEIETVINEKKALAPTTILSLLSRLEKKQFVSVTKEGKTNYYTPLISQEEYQNCESKNVLERVFGNSLKSFVTSLYRGKELTQQDVAELYDYIQELYEEFADQGLEILDFPCNQFANQAPGEDQDIHRRPALRRLVGDGRPHVALVPLRALHPALRTHRVGVNRAARRRNVYVRVVRPRSPIEPRQRLDLRAQRRKRAARAVARSQKPALRADVLRKVGVVGVDVRVARRLIDALRRGDCEPPLIIAV